DRGPGQLAQPRLELGVALEAAPEGLRRHPHHDVARLASHDVAQRVRNGLADLVDEGEEHVVAGEVGLGHEKAGEMPCHAGWYDPMTVIFHTNIGGGYDLPNPAARADPGLLRLGQFHGLVHLATPGGQRLALYPKSPSSSLARKHAVNPESAILA